MARTPTTTAGDTRDRILDAAETLLRRHGLAKTTVVDVARALGMSHANVYRHFESKAALQDALVDRWLRLVMDPLEQVASGPGTAAERLEAWVLAFIDAKRQRVLTDAELYDAYYAAAMELRSVVEARLKQGRSHLVRIIREGIDRGEFKVSDAEVAAMAVMDSMVRFYHPHHVRNAPEKTPDDARRVLRLVIAGLRTGEL